MLNTFFKGTHLLNVFLCFAFLLTVHRDAVCTSRTLVSILIFVFVCDVEVYLDSVFPPQPHLSWSQYSLIRYNCQQNLLFLWIVAASLKALVLSHPFCVWLVFQVFLHYIVLTAQSLCDYLGPTFSLKQLNPTVLSLLSTGFSSLLRLLWLARSCVICLIFGCSCVSSCQLNIRHIPTESGIHFWPVLYLWKKTPMKWRCSGKWFWLVNFKQSVYYFLLLHIAAVRLHNELQ